MRNISGDIEQPKHMHIINISPQYNQKIQNQLQWLTVPSASATWKLVLVTVVNAEKAILALKNTCEKSPLETKGNNKCSPSIERGFLIRDTVIRTLPCNNKYIHSRGSNCDKGLCQI